MSRDQTDWKKKYKEAAMELERYESSQSEEQMRLIISHMTLGLQGQSSDLDTALGGIRQSLTAASTSLNRKQIAHLEKEVRGLDREREKTAKGLLEFIKQWIVSLRKMCVGDAEASLLMLERKAPEAVEHLYELPSYLLELHQLQAGLQQIPTNENKVEVADHSAAQSDVAEQVDYEAVASELIQLIDALNLSADTAYRADDLVKRLRKQLTFDDLVPLLSELIEIVQISAQAAHQDFEQYLINLNTQLSAVQGFLSENQSEQETSGLAQKQLDQQVRQEVSNIHNAVSQSSNLSELKVSVASQLDGIVRAMDEYRKTEEVREQRSQQRHDELMNQMKAMEEESSRVKAHMEEERMKARTDSLTGLPNRSAYDDHLSKEFQRWARYQQGFAVAVGDLDYFKSINDSYGHLAGDKVLRLIARVLSKTLRSADFIARYGGEEFVILLPSTSVDDAVTAVEKLREAVSKSPFNFHGEPVQITMSFGVSETREGDTKDALFERADAALYKAKDQGRNRVCIG